MKRIGIIVFGIILLQATSAFSQSHYQFPPATRIIDIPGDHFLTWKIDNDLLYLRERSLQSAIVWSDTLNTDLAVNMTDFRMQRFGETDQYRVFLIGFINGQSVISHATFSLQTHTFGPFRTDTLSNPGIETCSVSDTLLYLFTDDGQQAWSVTASGDVQLVVQNVDWTEMYTSTFTSTNNQILRMWNTNQNLHSRRYDLQLQPLADEDSLTILGDYTYRQELLRQWEGGDSLFAAFFTTDNTPIPPMKGRFMAWLSPDLEVLAVHTEEFPEDLPYYLSTPYHVAVTGEHVYFIGKLTPNGGPNEWRVYVYDRSFTPVCDFPAGGNFHHNLLLLNDRAYIIDDTPNYVELFLIDGCGVAGSEEKTQSDVRVYPNPTNGMVAIGFEPGTVEVVEVCDLNGKTLLKSSVEQLTEVIVDLSGFETGVYLIKGVGEKGTETVRVIVQD